MTNTQEYPTSKDAALRQLGVASSKHREALAGHVEFVNTNAGRQLLTRGTFAPTVIVGVGGTALIGDGDGAVTRLEAPYVIDSWAADQRRVAESTVVTESPAALILVDWSHRDAVFAAVPALSELSVRTQDETAAAEQSVVSATERSSQPQPAN